MVDLSGVHILLGAKLNRLSRSVERMIIQLHHEGLVLSHEMFNVMMTRSTSRWPEVELARCEGMRGEESMTSRYPKRIAIDHGLF
jgi:hypothetical protein